MSGNITHKLYEVKMTNEIKYHEFLARVAYPISIYVPILHIYDIIYKNINNIKEKKKSEIETIEPLTQKIMAIF